MQQPKARGARRKRTASKGKGTISWYLAITKGGGGRVTARWLRFIARSKARGKEEKGRPREGRSKVEGKGERRWPLLWDQARFIVQNYYLRTSITTLVRRCVETMRTGSPHGKAGDTPRGHKQDKYRYREGEYSTKARREGPATDRAATFETGCGIKKRGGAKDRRESTVNERMAVLREAKQG